MADPISTITEVTEAAESAVDTVVKVKEAFLDPMLETIQQDINRIDLTIEGLDKKTKQFVYTAMRKLLDADNCIKANRRSLKGLATDTISRVEMLQEFFNLLNNADVIDNVEATAATIKTAIEDFTRMQQQIHTLLTQATKSYQEALADLADVKAAMESFVTGVDNLKKQHDAGEGWVKDFRAKVYGTATVSAIFGPIGVALTYAIAAGIVETKIKEWEVKINRLYISIKTARQSANSIMLKADKRIAYINTELDLIADWKTKVRAAIDSAGNMIDVVQAAFDRNASATIIIQKNRVVKVLDDLSAAAQAYLNNEWVADAK